MRSLREDLLLTDGENCDTIKAIKESIKGDISCAPIAPKSGKHGNLGLNITIHNLMNYDVEKLCEIENVVYVNEE